MTGTVVGPLHGIPMTFKDQFNVQGIDTTLGYVGRSFKPAETDAVLVKIMRKLGAIIIAKTTIPQSILVSVKPGPRIYTLLLTNKSVERDREPSVGRDNVSRQTAPQSWRIFGRRGSCSSYVRFSVGLGNGHWRLYTTTSSALWTVRLEAVKYAVTLCRGPCIPRWTIACAIFCWSPDERFVDARCDHEGMPLRPAMDS